MEDNRSRSHLELKPVTLEHLEEFNSLLRYVFQVTNRDLQESGYKEGEIVRAKRPVLKRSDVIGWFNGDKLVSQLAVYPCHVNIHGKAYKMGGLTGVGTYPEYANMGLMKDLIADALRRMRENGQFISYLYPYSIPYYRRKGWEIISEHLTFTVKDTQLPRAVPVPGYVERLPVTHPDVLSVYDEYAEHNHGAMYRDKVDWEEYWRWENEDERIAAVYYDKRGVPTGYLLYWIADDVLNIKDMIYHSQEARNGLWNFISAHHSMIDVVSGNLYRNDPIAFLLDDSQIIETLEPYYMARVVDVAAFLKEYPFTRKSGGICFEVTDPLAEWNNGAFSLQWQKNGKLAVTRERKGHVVRLDIQTFTALMMSFRSPRYFHEIQRMAADKRALTILENILPSQRPYFSDYF